MGQSSSVNPRNVHLSGYCDFRYTPVRNHLKNQLLKGDEKNVQLCVYVNGKCVIDLYGTSIGDLDFNREKIQTIYGSGKSIESIILGLLHSQDLFKYDDKVSKHWPEFAQNGKEDVRICDILRHESGLAWFTESLGSIKDAWIELIKNNEIGEWIEKQPLHFPQYPTHVSKSEYHAISRGLILNEIVRRIDLKKRTMGEIMRQDLCIEGIYCGLNKSELPQTVSQIYASSSNILKRLFKAQFSTLRFHKYLLKIHRGGNNSERPAFGIDAKNVDSGQDLADFFHAKNTLKAELPSCHINMQANARGCAELASIMATGGYPIMSSGTWKEMHAAPEANVMFDFSADDIVRGNFTRGGFNYFTDLSYISKLEQQLYKHREGYYGWIGYGGSIVQWNPSLEIGFAFLPTYLNPLDLFNERGAVIQKMVKDCVLRVRQEKRSSILFQ